MTERSYRIVLGLLLMLILYFQSQQGVILFIALLVVEGITNWRLPLIVTRLRSGKPQADPMIVPSRFSFEAERALRLSLATLLALSSFVFADQLWFFPWFASFALTMAGITGICPMAILLKKAGFR